MPNSRSITYSAFTTILLKQMKKEVVDCAGMKMSPTPFGISLYTLASLHLRNYILWENNIRTKCN